jgi:hypothetical protein
MPTSSLRPAHGRIGDEPERDIRKADNDRRDRWRYKIGPIETRDPGQQRAGGNYKGIEGECFETFHGLVPFMKKPPQRAAGE